LTQLPPIKEIIQQYGIDASKKLGQNFLFDQNLTDKIVRSAGDLDGKTVIEIGPGPGLLTRSILSSGAAKIIAFEKDPRCINALTDYLVPASDGRLTIVDADALKADIFNGIDGKVKIIANLPYNIATELLIQWLDKLDKIERMTLMFQREVAMRITAEPKCKDYGRLSVKAQWLCDAEVEFDIAPEAFYPPPKVTSTVITLIPRDKPLAEADGEILEKVCKAVFGQRRKVLRGSLKQITDKPLEVLAKAGIGEMQRPEELSIEEFCALARSFAKN
jgi:16S rRNA (adenine1518-N6/adenine1519-N6)-dimethyltransferase